MTPALLAQCTGATLANAARFAAPLAAAMPLHAIDSPRRQAAFLATVAIESARLTAVEEGLYYSSAERLCQVFKRAFPTPAAAQSCVRNPAALSRKVYAGYHGRGLIQMTWLDNYAKASVDLQRDYVGNPARVCEPSDAALTAAWFWTTYGCNAPADRGDMTAVTRIVNGPALMHLGERQSQYLFALGVFE